MRLQHETRQRIRREISDHARRNLPNNHNRNRGAPSLARHCLDAAGGDPYAALDLAIDNLDIIERYHQELAA